MSHKSSFWADQPAVLAGMWNDSRSYRARDEHRADQWAENRYGKRQSPAVSDRGGLRGSKATKQRW